MPSVREPIQVYLSSEERRLLDLAARRLGVSRSEVLRRGLRAVGESSVPGSALVASLGALAAGGALTPAKAGPGAPPPSRPIAPLRELLAELARDREDR